MGVPTEEALRVALTEADVPFGEVDDAVTTANHQPICRGLAAGWEGEVAHFSLLYGARSTQARLVMVLLSAPAACKNVEVFVVRGVDEVLIGAVDPGNDTLMDRTEG